MCSKETSRVQRQKVTKAKLKTKMVVSKAFLALPVRKSPEISVTCLSRKTHLKFSSSLKLKEKSLGATLGLTQHKVQQSRETSVYTQDAEPYLFDDEENEEGPLNNAPGGRKEKGTCEVKQSVLRTISRMLQENRIIRKQWNRLSQHYSFPSLELRGPNLFQHDQAPVHKASSMKTSFAMVGVEELECPEQSPDLNPTEHLWDELERRLHPRPTHPTNALVAE
ncbi:uncharacterized protein LOC124628872 isoform X2 [Ictalurus punctatus]|uniref:Uncharacterized protein LOC124628872 isoform X2 n=1 Tax=Ictalurus punctatus TaxID=7998 RepID=A0A979F792_ICTPU|nr:uncharacterized protein LOC124628872 isoform X2 [Ictalurus punctatus]